MSSFSTTVWSERERSMIERLPQVRLIAAQLHRRCPSQVLLEDLVSAGFIGLVEASKRFDPARNLKFKTLAEHRIRGAMLDYLRSFDPLPRAVRRFVRQREAVLAGLKGTASEEEIAAAMKIPIERYRRLSQMANSSNAEPQDRSARVGVVDPPAGYRLTLRREVSDALNRLPECERTIMLALGEGYSLREISRDLKVTPGRVSQLRQQALITLRIALGVTRRSRRQVCSGQLDYVRVPFSSPLLSRMPHQLELFG